MWKWNYIEQLEILENITRFGKLQNTCLSGMLMLVQNKNFMCCMDFMNEYYSSPGAVLLLFEHLNTAVLLRAV